MPGIASIAGRGSALERDDVDTDQIIPAAWLKRVERTGFAAGLFEAWRGGPSVVLKAPRAEQGTIMGTGGNFCCRSVRQHPRLAPPGHGVPACRPPGLRSVFC